MGPKDFKTSKNLSILQELALEMKEFILTYPDGLRFKYITDDKPPHGGEHRPQIISDGRDPGPDDLDRYKEWIHQTTQSLANEWKIQLIHVFVLRPNVREVWGYEPGGKPVQVSSA